MASKRFFAQKKNQDLFCRLLDENEGHVEKTLADKRINKTRTLLHNEFDPKFHNNQAFKKRVKKIKTKHKRQYKDKEWGESTAARLRRLHNHQLDVMEKQIKDGKPVDNKELNLLRYSVDDHLKSRAQIDSYRLKAKQIEEQLKSGAAGHDVEQNENGLSITIKPAGQPK